MNSGCPVASTSAIGDPDGDASAVATPGANPYVATVSRRPS